MQTESPHETEQSLCHEEWFLAEVEKSLAQVDSGKTLSHEEVGTQLRKYLAAAQTRNRADRISRSNSL
jgi:predicted transcriptional regulator